MQSPDGQHAAGRDGGATVAASLEVADGVWSRFKGLQFRAALPPDAGLLLVPCPSVHTFFMRFPIDVVLLDRGGCVVAVRRHVRPWRIVPPVWRAYATLELPAGAADLEPGVSERRAAARGMGRPGGRLCRRRPLP